MHCLGEGRFAEAERLFRAARPEGGNYEYDVIFGYLAGLRRGAPDRAWLRQERLAGPGWPAPIRRYLAGEIDRAALLQAARDPFDLRTTEQQCEAYLSLGMVALAAGDKEAAQREFENCVQSGIVGFIEYDLARRELARLRGADQPSPSPSPSAVAAQADEREKSAAPGPAPSGGR